MSCGCSDNYNSNSAYNGYCNADTPYPSVSHESVPSLIDNLVTALYGEIQKDVSSGKVVWNIPCDPSNIPATINGIPRNDGEGLLCYIVRALNLTTPSGFVTVNGVQTLTNKTLVSPTITGSGAIAGVFTGNVTGNLTGNVTGNVTGNLTGNVTGNLTGNVTGNVTGNATTATTATNIASGVAGAVPYQTAPSTTGFTAAGTSGQVLLSNGTSAPTWSTNIAGNSGTATQLQTSRTLGISGDVTGTASFDGSANATIAGTIANNAVTSAKLGATERLQLAKAWVNFDGTISGTWAGGASTVTRTAGSTTATITTTNNHGLTTGNSIYALSGVVAGSYVVTVLTSTTFNITTVATTALSAVAITFQGSTIRSSYNVSSITKNGTGDYTVNFATPMADTNYSVAGIAAYTAAGQGYLAYEELASRSTSSVRVETITAAAAAGDSPAVQLSVFGN
jgi:hypothetical protein